MDTNRHHRAAAERSDRTVTFAKMRERLDLADEAYAEAREEGHGYVSAGLAASRAAAGRQAKDLDQDEIMQRLARIAGQERDDGRKRQREIDRDLGWEL